MTDYSKMSDSELLGLVQPKPSADFSKMSDADLLAHVNDGQPPAEKPGYIMDSIKSIPRGLLSGITDAASASGRAAQAEMGQEVDAPTPEQGMAIMEKNVTGPLYQPQTAPGRMTAAGASAVTNPMSYLGPGGLGLKVAGAFLSGAGSEGAGQAAEGSGYEIPARLAGGLAGGAAAVKALGPVAERAAVPKYNELKGAANNDYQAARNSGLEVDPKGFSAFAAKAEQDLSGADHGFTGGQYGDAPKTFAILERLQNPPTNATVTASNIDAMRKNLARLSRETAEGKPTPDSAAASVALGHLKDYTEAIPQSHILAGDAALYDSATKQGNANYAAAQRVRIADTKINAATNNAEGGVATSIDNQLKSQFRQILNNPGKQRGFTADELSAIKDINKGSLVSNALRQAGRGGAGVIPMMAHLTTAAATHGATLPASIALAPALFAARKISEGMTVSSAKKLAEMLAKRSPEYERRAAQVKQLSPSERMTPAAQLARSLLVSH